MTISALRERRVANEIRCVGDGEELSDYLFHRGGYAERRAVADAGPDPARPQHAQEGRARGAGGDQGRPRLRSIPVVVLTTSKAEEDIARTYDLGVNSFITKPVTFDGLVRGDGRVLALLARDRRAAQRARGVAPTGCRA